MALIAELLGNANKMDLKRVANGERVPQRGKKKHGSQMTKVEKQTLLDSLRNVDKWYFHNHALDRIIEKGINATNEDIVSVTQNADIVEYHQAKHRGKTDNRVLLASKAIVNECYKLKVVYSLTRKEIVSVWMNHISDKHSTLDMRDYDKNLKILGV